MSRVKLVRTGATIYFVLFLVFVTWPGFIPFNRPLPLVLGLPFNMAMIALWVAAGALVLFILDRSEHTQRRDGRARNESRHAGDGRARSKHEHGADSRRVDSGPVGTSREAG